MLIRQILVPVPRPVNEARPKELHVREDRPYGSCVAVFENVQKIWEKEYPSLDEALRETKLGVSVEDVLGWRHLFYQSSATIWEDT